LEGAATLLGSNAMATTHQIGNNANNEKVIKTT
jgi:hypothetical protein